MYLVVEAWDAQTLLIAAVTLMLTVWEVPGQNQKPSRRDSFDLQGLHLTDMLTVTKQKSEHFALNKFILNTSDCTGSGTVPGSSLFDVDALIHPARGVKPDQ